MEGEGSDGGTDGGKTVVVLASHFVCRQSFLFVGGHSHWWAVVFVHGWGVMLWALVFVHWGRCHLCCRLWSQLLFLRLGRRLWAHHRCSWAVGRVCGWCMSFMWVASVLSWCHHGASLCHMAPASGCEKGMGNSARHSPEHTRW